jgi:translation elongation factor P/translation initiation factor 5A
MKLAEIRVGEFYAVSVNEKQVDLVEPDGEEFGLRRLIALSMVRQHIQGRKARVVGFEKSATGRTVVRVELTARHSRSDYREEDNFDGTKTIWRGIVVDGDGNIVEDDETFEALIQPMQVYEEWDESVVRVGVRHAERVLRGGREWDRYFGGSA